MSDIQLPQPEQQSRIHRTMDELCVYEEINKFSGDMILDEIFYFYLYHKYKANCLSAASDGIDIILCPGDEENTNCINSAASTKTIINNICDCIAKEVEILLIPITLIFRNGSPHANLLIYRGLYGTMEIFEPHGQDFLGDSLLFIEQTQIEIDKAYRKLILQINLTLKERDLIYKNVRLIKHKNVCPVYDGLQSIEANCKMKTPKEGEGYCAVYCMFFAELVLMNPTKTSKQLMEEIFVRLNELDDPSLYLLKVIRGYVGVIKQIFETKLHIMLGRDDISYEDVIELWNNKNRTLQEEQLFQHILQTNALFLRNNTRFFHSEGEKQKLLNEFNKSPTKLQQFLDFIKVSPIQKKRTKTPAQIALETKIFLFGESDDELSPQEKLKAISISSSHSNTSQRSSNNSNTSRRSSNNSNTSRRSSNNSNTSRRSSNSNTSQQEKLKPISISSSHSNTSQQEKLKPISISSSHSNTSQRSSTSNTSRRSSNGNESPNAKLNETLRLLFDSPKKKSRKNGKHKTYKKRIPKISKRPSYKLSNSPEY
jgi:hypothetical protein